MAEIRAASVEKQVILFLDYDGTLVPIADRPRDALLPPSTRALLRSLSQSYPVVISSGRGRLELEELIAVEGLYYAGSHGCDVEGPPGAGVSLRQGAQCIPELAAIAHSLKGALAGMEGVIIEDKTLSVAIHYRMVPEAQERKVREAVTRTVLRCPTLEICRGKKVIEVRPRVGWNKGTLVPWMVERLGLARSDAFPVCCGDDLTDEDAFRVVSGWGVGVAVRPAPGDTAARYCVSTVDGMISLLGGLASSRTRIGTVPN